MNSTSPPWCNFKSGAGGAKLAEQSVGRLPRARQPSDVRTAVECQRTETDGVDQEGVDRLGDHAAVGGDLNHSLLVFRVCTRLIQACHDSDDRASFGQQVVQPRRPPGRVDNHADRPILQDRQGFWCRDRGDTLPACAVCLCMSVRSAASQEPQVGVVPADPLEGKDHLVPGVVGHAARGDHEHRIGLVASINLDRHSLNPGRKELGGVPVTPYLTAWASSGKSGRATREQALRLMAIRQARLEPLALSASGHERMINGRAAASGGERIGFSAGIACFGA